MATASSQTPSPPAGGSTPQESQDKRSLDSARLGSKKNSALPSAQPKPKFAPPLGGKTTGDANFQQGQKRKLDRQKAIDKKDSPAGKVGDDKGSKTPPKAPSPISEDKDKKKPSIKDRAIKRGGNTEGGQKAREIANEIRAEKVRRAKGQKGQSTGSPDAKKPSGYWGLFKRIFSGKGCLPVIPALATIVRVVIALKGGQYVNDIMDKSLGGEKKTDKVYAGVIIAACGCNCCFWLLPVIAIGGLMIAIFGAFS
ncbi:hypothetical protein HQ571_05210 [Candidatus Kuenenbacteria bacterium]|nr:hypothetical protein [Candidatus Kuenenbacteria bacterium]